MKASLFNMESWIMVVFDIGLKSQLILQFSLFSILFMGNTILFQLTFIFIYNTSSNKFLVSAK